ncbi:hypothetical protein DUNSADRAFT_6520 [Dunaliella salina]|uniref:SET domain-containing protein n=1 Tax=Dunaliella salina TaxID=3046 RepID=A0ABQ7GN61_DUNSA|nr:hypothetical protein DUNSADRAFT_6520 [Dunaliella salina]|eukprot:KAF5836050.1 hypothetical protein DUNSADRAFT_6520 [Dunaliella salina]
MLCLQPELMAWADSLLRGYVHPDVDLFHPLPNGDRGVVALKDVKEGTELVVLPTANTLHMPTQELLQSSPEDAYSEAAHFLANHTSKPSPFVATVMLLLAEMAKGEASPFATYIKSLPEEVDCLLAWDSRDKEELKGTSIEDPTGGQSTQGTFDKEVAPKEGTDLYLIPAIDMINHASNPAHRNSSLLKLNTSKTVQLGDGEASFSGFFLMKADRDIRSGEQVLHTYGDHSDAALLQTYGFIDDGNSNSGSSTSQPGESSQAAGSSVGSQEQTGNNGQVARKAGQGSQTERGGPSSSASAAASVDTQGWVNPHNHALVPFSLVEQCTRGMLSEAMAGQQTAAPMATDFVVTQAMPLPDELLTAVQVLLLTREEFEDLKQARSEEEKEEAAQEGSDAASKGTKPTDAATSGQGTAGAAESGGPSSAANAGGHHHHHQQQQQQGHKAGGHKPLLLGTSLIGQDPDFAELVSLTLIQVLDAALQKYPTSLQEDLQLLQAQPRPPAYGQTEAEAKHARRKHLALKVRVAEKTVLQAAKREAVMLVLNLQSKRGGSMEGSDSLEEDLESDDGDDDDDEEEMGSEEEADLLQQLLQAKQKQEQKQQAGPANTKVEKTGQQPSGSSGHRGKRKHGGTQEETTKQAKRGK